MKKEVILKCETCGKECNFNTINGVIVFNLKCDICCIKSASNYGEVKNGKNVEYGR